MLFEGKGGNSGLEDRGEQWRRDQLVWVVKKGIDEEAVEILNDVRKIDGRQVAHHTKHIRSLRLKEDVNVLSDAVLHVLAVFGEFSKDSTSSPEKATLLRLCEAFRQVVGQWTQQGRHGGPVRDDHEPPRSANPLADGDEVDKVAEDG